MSFACVGFGGLGMLQPNRLPGKTKAAMAIIAPAGLAREMVEFLEGKGALDRDARVVASHRLAKNRGREQIDAEFRKPAPAQIGDQYFPTRKAAATTQQRHRLVAAEMMQREREEHDVVGMFRRRNDGCPRNGNGSRESRRSAVARSRSLTPENPPRRFPPVAPALRANSTTSRGISPEPVARSRMRSLSSRPNPASEEIADQTIAAEVTIEGPQIAQVGQAARARSAAADPSIPDPPDRTAVST